MKEQKKTVVMHQVCYVFIVVRKMANENEFLYIKRKYKWHLNIFDIDKNI